MPAALLAPPAAPPAKDESGLPILKWVGGKARLLPHITGHYTSQSRVVEPFFGGGAVSFHLASQHPGLEVVANDKIAELVEIYEAVRTDVETFITAVDTYASAYLACDGKDARRKHYYTVREDYMTQALNGPAPLFFMLWCAYSGMYRTGKTYPGRFNTPHGFGKEKTGFYHPQRLRAAASAMSTWTFSSADFFTTMDAVTSDTFVFLDPPYRHTYADYTDDGFDDADHLRVIEFFKDADARGAKVVYTNKYTDDGYYEDHFNGFTITKVPIKYQVNRDCATAGRTTTYEAFVTN